MEKRKTCVIINHMVDGKMIDLFIKILIASFAFYTLIVFLFFFRRSACENKLIKKLSKSPHIDDMREIESRIGHPNISEESFRFYLKMGGRIIGAVTKDFSNWELRHLNSHVYSGDIQYRVKYIRKIFQKAILWSK